MGDPRQDAVERLRGVTEQVARLGANLLRATDGAYAHGLRAALLVVEAAHRECGPGNSCPCHARTRDALLELITRAEGIGRGHPGPTP